MGGIYIRIVGLSNEFKNKQLLLYGNKIDSSYYDVFHNAYNFPLLLINAIQNIKTGTDPYTSFYYHLNNGYHVFRC